MKLYLMTTALVGLLASHSSFAETNSGARIRFAAGKIIVAQSYCKICSDQRLDCVVRCNGAGACIQNCDDDFRLCTERACQYRR